MTVRTHSSRWSAAGRPLAWLSYGSSGSGSGREKAEIGGEAYSTFDRVLADQVLNEVQPSGYGFLVGEVLRWVDVAFVRGWQHPVHRIPAEYRSGQDPSASDRVATPSPSRRPMKRQAGARSR